MGHFSIQTITALVEVVTGGSGLGDRRGQVGIYRTGPILEQFLGAAGIELSIGSDSRIPSVRRALIATNENNYEAIVRLIEQVVDPREYIDYPEKLKEVVDHLNARLCQDGYELVHANEACKLSLHSSTEVAAPGNKEKVETLESGHADLKEATLENAKNLPTKAIPVFPNIIPSSIKESKFRIIEKGDLATDKDVRSLMILLFNEPECEFYYFHEKGTQLDISLQNAINCGDIRIIETKFFYYKHPKNKRNYVHIEKPHGHYEWEKEVVEKDPMFCRCQLELSQRKRREFEIQQLRDSMLESQNASHTNKKGSMDEAGALEPKPPEFLQKMLWLLKYGKKHWKLILLAVIILGVPFSLKFNLHGKILNSLTKKTATNSGQTQLYPRTKKRVNDFYESIRNEKLDPWLFINTRARVRVTKYNGDVIDYSGVMFTGSPRLIFWSDDFIPPFIENAIIKVFDQTIDECRRNNLDPKIYIYEAKSILDGFIFRIYNRMAEMDQELLKQSHPENSGRRDVKPEIEKMRKCLDEQYNAALLLASGNENVK